MLGALTAHVAVVAMWGGAAALAAGIGHLIHRALGVVTRDSGFRGTVWTGLLGTITGLNAWHLFRPIDAFALAAVSLAGLVGLLTGLATSGWKLPRVRVAHGVAVAVAALWIANRCLAPLNAHDTIMYMLPALEWTRSFPAVPGLGALHGRLAFNSANVLLGALVEAGHWRGAPHLVAGFFLLLLAATALQPGPAAHGRGTVRIVAFDRLMLVPLVAMALDDQLVPSLSADVGVTAALLCGLSALNRSLSDEAPRDSLVSAGCAAVVAATLKLSAAGMGAALWLVALYRLYAPTRPRSAGRPVAGYIAVSATALGLWAAHGVITSGYPLYPSTLFAAPVDWRVPAEQAAAESAWIGHFARSWPSTAVAHAGDVVAMRWLRFAWLRPWLMALVHGEDRGVVSIAGGLLIALLVWIVASAIGRRWQRAGSAHGAIDAVRRVPGTLSLYACALAGALFWFVVAPRPTFGIAGLWALVGLLLGIVLGRLRPPLSIRASAVVPALLCIGVVANDVRLDEPGLSASPAAWRWTLLRDADETDWFREPAPGEFVRFETREGVSLSVPASGNLCGRQPLPCTPHPSPNLAWRAPGHPARGFVIHGAWEPLRWPKEGSHFLAGWRASKQPEAAGPPLR